MKHSTGIKLVLLGFILCNITCFTRAAGHIVSSESTPFDSTGAIQVKDPFSACHADSYDLMVELGVKDNRKDISWSGIEPTDDAWNWDWWDYRVGELKARNMTTLPILDYGNLNVQTGTTHGNRIHTDHDIQEWLEYVNACIERYYENDTTTVTPAWEIWNEPNLGDFNASSGFWTGTDEEYFHLQTVTAANITARWPDLNVVSAGIAGHNPAYLDAMFASGAMEHIDTLAFHPYSVANYDTLDVKINEVKAVCEKYNFNGPLWITEVGMSTQFNPDKPGYEAEYQHSLELQASLVPKVYAKSLANGIEVVVWYCLGDGANRTWGEENFGLIFEGSNPYKPAPYANDTFKPSGYAYKALAHNLNWSKYIPKGVRLAQAIPSSNKLETFYFLKSNGDIVLVMWNGNGEMPVNVSFTVPSTGIEAFSAPSYKAGDARNYSCVATADGLFVEARVGFYPFIFVFSMNGTAPVTIVLNTSITVLDASMLFIVPALVVVAVIAFARRLQCSKKRI